MEIRIYYSPEGIGGVSWPPYGGEPPLGGVSGRQDSNEPTSYDEMVAKFRELYEEYKDRVAKGWDVARLLPKLQDFLNLRDSIVNSPDLTKEQKEKLLRVIGDCRSAMANINLILQAKLDLWRLGPLQTPPTPSQAFYLERIDAFTKNCEIWNKRIDDLMFDL